MRVRTHTRILKTASTITLMFFSWSFGPLYAPVAAFAEQQKNPAGVQRSDKPASARQQPEERFESVLDDIREGVGRAGEKLAKGEDESADISAVKAKRAELESLDSEIRKTFAATEKKLKDSRLPQQILERHSAFVKHYADNYNQLRAEINDIDAAKGKTDRKAKIEKAQLHLEKVKKPSTHQKLDPNNLPFRARKAAKMREPRTKEQFEKDFPQQKSQSKKTLADNRLLHELLANASKPRPVLLAFNGPDSDMPFQLPLPSGERTEVRGGFDMPQWTLADSSPFLLAQAPDQPSADDLAETPDVQFTDAIRVKAEELGRNPVKIYEWVRNNIEYAPTYGSIQGADQCLQSKICNDMDAASLLIALLRVSGIYAHYVYGTIEVPIDKAMNWVGGVTDPKMAGTILSTNGIPAKMLVSGGTYKAVQLEHVYVNAFIDYIPSRGAVHKQGDTWIPIDPSFKQYTYTQGINIQSAVPFDAQSFANQIQSTATTNTIDGSVTNVNSTYVQQTMQDYQTQVQNYITQNNPNATVGDVIGKKEIVKQEHPYLMGTLPYKTVQIGADFAEIPSDYRATMSFSIPDQTGIGAGLSYSTSLPQIAGKKITLSFSPATASDQAVIESLLPQPHADGTPIEPSELPSSFKAYLISLEPELRIDGQVVATGSPVTMGRTQPFKMSLNEPAIGISNIDNIVKAGEYFGIGVDTGRIGASRLNAHKARLETMKAKFDTQNYDGLTKDDILGDLLYTTITSYFAGLDLSDEGTAQAMNLVRFRAISVGMFSCTMNVNEVFGVPTSAGARGMLMDVDRIIQSVFAKDGDANKIKPFMLSSGGMSSALEHLVPEKIYSTQDNAVHGISSVKALQIANDQGIPIYTIKQSNINMIIPHLQIDEDAKRDIANAVNAGKEVIVSKTNVTYNGWLGCGYIISDPITGAGAYMISGGQNGAIILLLLGLALLAIGVCMVAGIGGPVMIGLGVLVMALTPLFLAALFWLAYQASPAFVNNFSLIFTGVGLTILLAFVSLPLTLIIGIYLGLSAIWAGWQFSFINIRRLLNEYYEFA